MDQPHDERADGGRVRDALDAPWSDRGSPSLFHPTELMDAVRKYSHGRTNEDVLALLESERSAAEPVEFPPGWELIPLRKLAMDQILVRGHGCAYVASKHDENVASSVLFYLAVALLEAAPHVGKGPACADQVRKSFQGFHRELCERFGFRYDADNWCRQQDALIEHIASGNAPQDPGGVRMRVKDGFDFEPLGEQELDMALQHLQALRSFAHNQGFPELDYSPLSVVCQALGKDEPVEEPAVSPGGWAGGDHRGPGTTTMTA